MVDIVLAHSAPCGVGDANDLAHRGFESFRELIDTYHPKLVLHGHLHLNCIPGRSRMGAYHGTQVINCCERYVLQWNSEEKTDHPGGFIGRIRQKLAKQLEIME